MPETVDPEDRFVTDDVYAEGRKAFEEGRSVLESPLGDAGALGRAWLAGWLDALADRLTGHDRSAAAYHALLALNKGAEF